MTTPSAGPSGGIRVGRVLGVPVYVAPSWFLFAAVVVASLAPPLERVVGPRDAYIAAVSLAVMLGLSVLLHEIGHCVVARAYGLPVRSITITFLAGFTEVMEPPQTPGREYSVAIAGPMVSLLLAGVGLALVPAFEPDTLARFVIEGVAGTNGLVAAFNLLPGLPLDGGRVLRSALWGLGVGPDRATRISAQAGRGVALAVLPILLLGLPALGYGTPGIANSVFGALVAAYIFTAATATLRRAQLSSRLPLLVAGSLARPAIAVPAELPLAEAVRRAHASQAQGLVVVDSADRLEGVVSEAAVRATPEERRPWVTVGQLARRVEEGLLLDPELRGEALIDALRRTPASEYVVRHPDGQSVMVLVAEDVARAMTA